MDKPLIFFVDDEPNVLNGLKRFCRSQRTIWDMHFFDGGDAALKALAQHPADVVVSDMRMPNINGADLFEQISLYWPGIIRIMLSGEAEPEQTMRTVGRSHRFLAKPCAPKALIQAIDAPLQKQAVLGLSKEALASSFLDRLHTPPAVFEQMQALLEAGEINENALEDLITSDPALSARLLQLANSAYFGRPVATCNIKKALKTIGTARLGKLLQRKRLGNHANSRTDHGETAPSSDIAQFKRLCAQMSKAKQLPQEQHDLIFTAGLFHKLGMIQSETGDEPSKEQRAIPAYMASLLGLPSALSDLLSHGAQSEILHLDPQARLDSLFALVSQSNNQAA